MEDCHSGWDANYMIITWERKRNLHVLNSVSKAWIVGQNGVYLYVVSWGLSQISFLGYLNSTVLSEEKYPIKSELRLGCGPELLRNPSASVSPLLRCQLWATIAALNVGSWARTQFFPSLSPAGTNWVLSTTPTHCFFNIDQPRNISFDLPLIPVFLLNFPSFFIKTRNKNKKPNQKQKTLLSLSCFSLPPAQILVVHIPVLFSEHSTPEGSVLV